MTWREREGEREREKEREEDSARETGLVSSHRHVTISCWWSGHHGSLLMRSWMGGVQFGHKTFSHCPRAKVTKSDLGSSSIATVRSIAALHSLTTVGSHVSLPNYVTQHRQIEIYTHWLGIAKSAEKLLAASVLLHLFQLEGPEGLVLVNVANG